MPQQNEVTPEPIFKIMGGYMASQHLFAANDIGLFEALAKGPATLSELADRTNTQLRPTGIVADALVALDMLERDSDRYQNTPATATFLAGRTPADLRPIVRLNHEVQYPDLVHFAEAVRTGQSIQKKFTEQEQRMYSYGIAAASAGTAQALASTYDFGRHRRLLDLGGGVGSVLATVLRRHDHLDGTLFDQPEVISLARERLQARSDQSPAERIEFVADDFFEDSLPAGHDAILLTNIVHNFPPDGVLRLLRRVRDAASDATRLLLVDFWTDPTHTEPAFAALLASMLFLYAEGGAYSVAEARDLLAESDWKITEHTPLDGPASLIVASPR